MGATRYVRPCFRTRRLPPAGCRAIALVLAMSAFIGFAAIPAGAETIIGAEFRHKSWAGSARFDKTTGRFSHCAIASAYKSGNFLSFAFSKDGLWLGVGNKSWSLKANAEYPVTLSIDKIWELPTVAVALADRQRASWIVYVKLGKAGTVAPMLKRGNLLSVRTPQQTIKFTLNDVRIALIRLQECFDDNRSRSSARPAPARAPRPNAALDLPPLVPALGPLAELRTVGLDTGVADTSLDIELGEQGSRNPDGQNPEIDDREIDVRDFAIWVRDTSAVGRELLALVKLINQIDGLSMAYLSNSITREYAKKNGMVKLLELQVEYERVSRALDRFSGEPPAIDEESRRSGRTLVRHFRQLRDQIYSMIGDTKGAFVMALKGDKKAYNRLFLKSFAQKISLLKTENLTLETQILSQDRESAQTRLSRSFMYSNAALIHILTFLEEAMQGKTLADSDLPRRMTDKSLIGMESTIERGMRLARNIQSDYGWNGKFWATTEQRSMSRLAKNYVEAFATERRIADRLHSFARTIFDIRANSTAPDPARIGSQILRQSVALDLLVKKRLELTSNRIAMAGAVKSGSVN